MLALYIIDEGDRSLHDMTEDLTLHDMTDDLTLYVMTSFVD